MSLASAERAHATVVAIKGRGVMIEGLPGAGKSDLALRLIDRGAVLVTDDQALLARDGDRLIASPPATIAGKMEVRGLGIVERNHTGSAPVSLIVDLDGAVDRMPDSPVTRMVAGVALPVVVLAAFEASAPIKVELALSLHGLPV